MTQSETDHKTYQNSDLTTCDQEPVHQIGEIQSVGFLIAISADWNIARASENAENYLGCSASDLLSISLRDVIKAEAVSTIRDRISVLRGADAVEHAFAVQLQDGGPNFDLAIHMTGNTILIEAEPSQPPDELNAIVMVRSMLARMHGKASLVREATRLVHALTGFDRVMVYRFHPDGSGEVIAETTRSGIEPYLGLRYPAEDIPQQARALLIRNPVRLLADTASAPSPVVPRLDGSNEPLDLSMSTLRAHSKMCIEYFRNMGVGATLTISLMRDRVLWGMISCHHMAARHLGLEQRTTVELFGQMLSFLIEKQERADLAEYELHSQQLHNQLIAAIVEKGSIGENIAELANRMADLVPCDGIAVCVDGELTLQGVTPTREEFALLRRFLDRAAPSQIYVTENLGKVYLPAQGFVERAAGILVIPISRSPRDYLVFFRQELARSVVWAGAPGKVLVTGPHGARLTPRKSFEAWREIVRGHSKTWTEAELRVAEALRVTLLEVILHLNGLTEKESRAATQKQELLIAELNHRVRNILGLIRGLVSQTRIGAADVDTFATVLGDRVHALARAHNQITAKNWEPAPLAVLIATEAAGFLGNGPLRIHSDGPAILLKPQAFSTMALVIHELITNAVKHGALADQHGKITISWSLTATRQLALQWQESGGPQVTPPTRRGFGSTIIHRSIPHELGGKATLDYATGGLRAQFILPAHHIVADDNPAVSITQAALEGSESRLSGLVLVVEDNMIIALEVEDMLLSLGATHVSVASNVAAALRLLDLETPTFALLDLNLGREMSWPVAARLRELNIPHIFATGYGDGLEYPLEHRSTPSLTKPYTSETIAGAINPLR